MIGLVVLPLIVILSGPTPSNRLESAACWSGDVDVTFPGGGAAVDGHGYPVGIDSLPCTPIACVPAYCETWEETDNGSLVCYDTDETFPAGHWAFTTDPDFGDWQVTTEY